jgi:DNA-directed RNA polymerase subunit RPC12/RpoP
MELQGVIAMYDRKQKIMEKIQTLPKGGASASGRYWCVTCKKLFRMEQPVCPYMTAMCVNSPIAIEEFTPESTEWLEKMGLFYPKIPQMAMAALLKANPAPIGKRLAETYLEFLAEWKIEHTRQPLQTLKSFVLVFSGCETAQRIRENEILFIVTDMQKIWDKNILFSLLKDAVDELKGRFGITQEIAFDSMEIIGERPMGKYYCGMCKKFFEFGIERDNVTCPLMAQKCMFDPVHIDKIKYRIADLIKVLRITPDLYSRFISLLPERTQGASILERILADDWKFEFGETELRDVQHLLGLSL